MPILYQTWMSTVLINSGGGTSFCKFLHDITCSLNKASTRQLAWYVCRFSRTYRCRQVIMKSKLFFLFLTFLKMFLRINYQDSQPSSKQTLTLALALFLQLIFYLLALGLYTEITLIIFYPTSASIVSQRTVKVALDCSRRQPPHI